MQAERDRLMSQDSSYPRLLADIGGTNARFALEVTHADIRAVRVLECKKFATLGAAMRDYLSDTTVAVTLSGKLKHAAFAIANPIDGDTVSMTNHHWSFSIQAIKAEFSFDTLLVVNDFTALAMSLPHLNTDELKQVGAGAPRARSVIGLVGVGTGVGVSGLVPSQIGWSPLASEGGHVSFSPTCERDIAVLRYAWRNFPHVSAERLLAGIGLDILYRALAEYHSKPAQDLTVPQIIERGLAGDCSVCDATIDAFCEMLGTLAGNVALVLGAKGGMYIGGGIVPRLGARFEESGFRSSFLAKGRLSAFLNDVPTYVISAQYPAFIGVSALLQQELVSKIGN